MPKTTALLAPRSSAEEEAHLRLAIAASLGETVDEEELEQALASTTPRRQPSRLTPTPPSSPNTAGAKLFYRPRMVFPKGEFC
jgi:hypothetical protein